jgi:hypothetical protein
LIQAENEALKQLQAICASRPEIVVVADRGFGNQRWLLRVEVQGFHFVRRLSCAFNVDTEHHIGALRDLNLRRGKPVCDWGLGLARVALKEHERYERLFYIVALAFILLSAHGALAETQGFDKGLKANTRKIRVINLLRMGYHFLRKKGEDLIQAFACLRQLATINRAPNWE